MRARSNERFVIFDIVEVNELTSTHTSVCHSTLVCYVTRICAAYDFLKLFSFTGVEFLTLWDSVWILTMTTKKKLSFFWRILFQHIWQHKTFLFSHAKFNSLATVKRCQSHSVQIWSISRMDMLSKTAVLITPPIVEVCILF